MVKVVHDTALADGRQHSFDRDPVSPLLLDIWIVYVVNTIQTFVSRLLKVLE